MDINIRIAGEAGQGVQTTGGFLVSAFASLGLHVFSVQSYMSRIRGGMNWYDVRIGDRAMSSGRERCDLLVAFTAEAANALAPTLAEGGLILCEKDCSVPAQHLAFTREAKDLTKSAVMANAVAAGSVFALLGYSIDHLATHIDQAFSEKGSEIVQQNAACARRGAELVADCKHDFKVPKPSGSPTVVYSGSEVIGLSAATSGVKFVSSYPMSPSTGVFTYLAKVADRYGIVVEQAEDEIAAINMICGATYAGAPAMTTTSGGGFALMGEGISLAGMMELPVVVLLAQRPGPATGLPTRTGQEDLRLALHAGHGEFPKAIFAPGSLEQAYTVTRHALEAAHRFQAPVSICER